MPEYKEEVIKRYNEGWDLWRKWIAFLDGESAISPKDESYDLTTQS